LPVFVDKNVTELTSDDCKVNNDVDVFDPRMTTCELSVEYTVDKSVGLTELLQYV
jgi:hypothetical protein